MAGIFRYCLVGILSFASLNAFALQTFDTKAPSSVATATASTDTGSYAAKTVRTWNKQIDLGNGQKFKFNPSETRRYGWGTIRSGISKLLKLNPGKLTVSLGIMAGLEAVGYVLDPANNQIKRPVVTPVPGQPGLTGWRVNETLPMSPTPAAACSAYAASSSGFHFSHVQVADPGYNSIFYCFLTTDFDPVAAAYVTAVGYGPCFENHTCDFTTEYEVVAPSLLDQHVSTITDKNIASGVALLLESSPEISPLLQSWPALSGDTVTTTGPATVTGETVVSTETTAAGTKVTTKSTEYGLTYQPGKTSVKTKTTTQVAENGVVTSTTVQENATGSVDHSPAETSPSEQPEQITDCDFMPTVCNFIEWVKTPEAAPADLEMPSIGSDDLVKTYSGPSLTTSCPAPFTVNTGFMGSVSIPVNALCDLASLIKYLVLSAAGLLAAFIISGTRRA